MVRTSLFASFDDLFEDLFYSYPTKIIKPPTEMTPTYNKDNVVTGCKIQLALSGVREDEIQVFVESGYLHIKVDNTANKDIPARFKCNFDQKYSYQDVLDIENAKKTFENGLLTIELPLKEKEKPVKFFL